LGSSELFFSFSFDSRHILISPHFFNDPLITQKWIVYYPCVLMFAVVSLVIDFLFYQSWTNKVKEALSIFLYLLKLYVWEYDLFWKKFFGLLRIMGIL
jgi:hypothetical protein